MTKNDIYTEITNRIIAELEKGIIPWRKPWFAIGGGAYSYDSKNAYSLVNQMLLGEPGEYITFNQCKKIGGKVKKGSKAKKIVFWKLLEKPLTDKSGAVQVDNDGKPITKTIPILQWYNVFNIKDCDGVKPKMEEKIKEYEAAAAAADQKINDEKAEKVFKDYIRRENISFQNSFGNKACYNFISDEIKLPNKYQFKKKAEYYSTLFHETVHSTGHPDRLNRYNPTDISFGSKNYSKEELVAEIGAAALCNQLQLESPDSFTNSAAYIQTWLKKLKDDKTLIISAAAAAEKAVKMILNEKKEA